jgi:cytochrome c556
MMKRKWLALGVTALTALALSAGLSLAADDDEGTPLGKIMEKVQKDNATIVKGVRNAVSYKKSQPDVQKAAESLVKLLKESRSLGAEPAKQQNKTVAEWEKLTDDCVKETAAFAALVAKADTTQTQAKDTFKAVSKSCTACHEVFRVDE